MIATNIPTVELSDLFFNYDHEEYNELFHDGESVDMDDIRVAIQNDAVKFVDYYPIVCEGVTATELAEDFMRRL